jgi:D-glycero-D-manno-heptose 1,7-bisphosphate phosphatase
MGVAEIMNKAVFLDRDGVINKLILNPRTGDFESPHAISDLQFFPWTFDALKRLALSNYSLFVVSNQPSFAKGKVALETLLAIQKKFKDIMMENGIVFTKCYYCYHHPNGVIGEYTKECECRKPKPFFVNKAVADYSISKNGSWFVGDRESDVLCGQAAGLKTILIGKPQPEGGHFTVCPDYYAENLLGAIEIIVP